MSTMMELEPTGVVGLPGPALHALRAALYRDLGGNAAAYLQEAGYAAGIYDVFERWVTQQTSVSAAGLPADEFGGRASDFFSSLGWGSMTMGPLGTAATLDSSD